MRKAKDESDLKEAPSFIRDEPASVDSFGPHTRLAGAIGRLIAEDPQIKIVGILGPWGSGKSTVVRAVEDQLRSKSSKVHFFTYDAWLHQSDPVRRSFLEALVTFLGEKGTVTETNWKKKLEDLNGSIEKTETETTPILTPTGKWILSSLAVVPLGFALIGYDNAKEAFGIWEGWSFIAGLTLTLAPVFVAAILYLCWRPWGTKLLSKAFWLKHKEPHDKDSILGILSDRSVDRVLSVTARQPEPTSIEFQQIFRELMTEAVNGGYSYVFVIDNLDRLAEREALQIWSAVRAFFLGSSDTPVAKTASYLPTVILPVDANSIRRMFALEHGEDDAKDLGRAFMDKTFDITFEVPEPVMSDWQDYLAKQLRESFGQLIGDGDIYWAVRFLDDKRRAKGSLVTTPRSINKFVNHTAALYTQRASEEIEIPTLAYYAAFSHLIEDNLLDFIQQSSTASHPPAANWQVQLAGVHFGAPLVKARQILLSDPIRNAVENLDYSSFKELSEIPGFSTELRRVVSNPPLKEQSGEVQFGFITNAAMLIDKEIASTEHWLAQTWSLIADQFAGSSTPTIIPQDLESRIVTVLQHAPADRRRRLLNVSAAKISGMIRDTNIATPSIQIVLDCANGLGRQARAWEIESPQFAPALNPPNYLTLLNHSASKPNIWRQLRSNHKPADLAPVLSDKLHHATDHATVPTCIRILADPKFAGVARAGNTDWDGVVATAADLLRNHNGSGANVGSAAVTLGLLEQRSDEAAKTLKAIVDEGHISNRLNEAVSAQAISMLSSGYAFLICRGGDFGAPSGMSWQSFLDTFPELPKDINVRIIDFFGPVIAPVIWEALERAPTGRPLVLAVIDQMLASAGLGSLYVDRTVQGVANFLNPLNSAQQRQFVLRLKTYDGFWKELEALDDGPTFLRVARSLKSGAPEDRKVLASIVQKRLEAADPTDWTEAIGKGGSLYGLALGFSGDVSAWPQKSNVYAALISHIPSVVSTDDREIIKRWFALFSQLTHAAQEKAVTALAERISEGGYVGDLLSLLRESKGRLLEPGVLKPAAAIRSIIVPLLEARPGRRWIMNNAQKFEPAVSKAPRDAIAVLRSELDRLARSPSKWRREDATKLRSLFDMK